MTVKYLVCASGERGVAEAAERGWTRIAYGRFATPLKDDVRLIVRFADLVPFAGRTMMIRGRDYEDGPDVEGVRDPAGDGARARWARDREDFERFVREGNGEWVEA